MIRNWFYRVMRWLGLVAALAIFQAACGASSSNVVLAAQGGGGDDASEEPQIGRPACPPQVIREDHFDEKWSVTWRWNEYCELVEITSREDDSLRYRPEVTFVHRKAAPELVQLADLAGERLALPVYRTVMGRETRRIVDECGKCWDEFLVVGSATWNDPQMPQINDDLLEQLWERYGRRPGVRIRRASGDDIEGIRQDLIRLQHQRPRIGPPKRPEQE